MPPNKLSWPLSPARLALVCCDRVLLVAICGVRRLAASRDLPKRPQQHHTSDGSGNSNTVAHGGPFEGVFYCLWRFTAAIRAACSLRLAATPRNLRASLAYRQETERLGAIIR
ncbi:hypothetical protein BU26DRAFT_228624 [Trematosphaeria pertusa]|uniref:Uncharacterized protein n=1 Tax=Trematosphaeria pertusa TaxID=390896 RepID=A0A6A6IT69_9PLEO|nr:uncharacterized protein BU26DRAFT_228624 [Trematosphaeria pertusa]KAF2253701.1 hypothetical protein BU26DRAFT_228624 [Trematosphaeria pertusa]